MSFGGSVSAMINSLKTNRRERRAVFKQEPKTEVGRDAALEFGECSEEDRQSLAEQLAQRVRMQRRKEQKALAIALSTTVILVALLLTLW